MTAYRVEEGSSLTVSSVTSTPTSYAMPTVKGDKVIIANDGSHHIHFRLGTAATGQNAGATSPIAPSSSTIAFELKPNITHISLYAHTTVNNVCVMVVTEVA